MKYASSKIVFQEVPNEVSLAFLVSGCPLKCPGCHSSNFRGREMGLDLTHESFVETILNHQRIITCVLFLGGEWYPRDLIHFLKTAHIYKFKTCLYTGLEQHEVKQEILDHLDFIKVGPFKIECGPLSHPSTNQKFLDLKQNINLTHHFQKKLVKERQHVTA